MHMSAGDDLYKRRFGDDPAQRAVEKLLRRAKDADVPSAQSLQGNAEALSLLQRLTEKDRALRELETQLSAREKELARKESDIAKSSEELGKARDEIAGMAKQREEYAALRKEMDDWERRRQDVYGQLMRMEDELKAREATITATERRMMDGERDLLKGLDMLRGLDAREDELRKREDELLRWEESKRMEEGALTKRLEQQRIKDEEISYRERELAKERVEIESGKARFAEADSLKSEVATVRAELERARAELEKERAHGASLASEIENSRLQIEAKSSEIQRAEADYEELRQKVSEAEAKVTELIRTHVPMVVLEQRDLELKRARDHIAEIEREKEDARSQLPSREAMNAMERELAAAKLELSKSKGAGDELGVAQETIGSLKGQVERYRKLLDEMQKGLKKATGLDKAMASLREEVAMLREKNDELAQKASAASQLDAEIARLRSELEDSEEAMERVKAEAFLASKGDSARLAAELEQRGRELSNAMHMLDKARALAEKYQSEAEHHRAMSERKNADLQKAVIILEQMKKVKQREETFEREAASLRARLDGAQQALAKAERANDIIADLVMERDALKHKLATLMNEVENAKAELESSRAYVPQERLAAERLPQVVAAPAAPVAPIVVAAPSRLAEKPKPARDTSRKRVAVAEHKVAEEARKLMERGRHSQAKTILDKLLRVDPRDVDALKLRAAINLHNENYAAAGRDLETALDCGLEEHGILISLGYALLKGGDYEGALHRFKRARRFEPDDPTALLGISEAMLMQDDFENALEGFERVIAVQPDSYEALAGAGRAMVELDRLTEAEEYLKRAYDLNSRRVEACLAMAMLMHRSEDYNGALVWAKRALLAEPDNREARKEMERANEAKRRKLTHFVPE